MTKKNKDCYIAAIAGILIVDITLRWGFGLSYWQVVCANSVIFGLTLFVLGLRYSNRG